MPWKASDAEGHTKKADTPAKQKTWAEIANKERQRCMADGGDAEECDARAIRVANAAIAKIKEGDMSYKAYTMSTSNVLIPVNAVDVDGEAVPVAELVAAYEEQRGQGQGVGGDRQGDGGADVCVCPECGHEEPHEKGTPCNETKCPECGAAMVGKEEEVSEQDDGKKDWQLTKSDIRELIGLIDAELGRRKKKKEQSEADLEIWEMEPASEDMSLEKLMAALFKSCPSRAGKTKGGWKSDVRSWVKTTATKSLTGYRRRLVMVGTKMGMKFAEASEADIGEVRALLEQALIALGDEEEEIAEAELCENVAFDAFMPEGDHSAAILEVVKEAGITAGKERRAPVVVDLQIIRPGPGNKRDNRYYPPSTLKNYAHVFEGADVFVTDHKASERSEKTKVGRIKQCPVRFTEVNGPVGRTIVYDPDMAEKIRNRADAGELDTLHCSILAMGGVRPGKVDGKKYSIVESISDGPLVEFVSRAGAGGHAVNLAENNAGGVNMDQEKIKELLSESELPQESQERLAGAEYEDESAVKEAILQEKARLEAPQKLEEAEITKVLSETNLPSASKKRLAEGEYEDESALREAILAEVEYVKKLTGSGQPFAQGGGTAPGEEQMSEADYDAAYADILRRHGLPVPQEVNTNA